MDKLYQRGNHSLSSLISILVGTEALQEKVTVQCGDTQATFPSFILHHELIQL